jgi:phosphoribosylanthranilate isomerase
VKNLPHYAGLTGAQTPDEAEKTLEIFHRHGFKPGAPHDNMVGVLVSPATIDNGEPMHSSKPWRQVQDFRTLVETLLRVEGRGVPMIHMELHKQWPGTPGDAESAIRLLAALQAHGTDPAIQLNGVLDPDSVKKIHEYTGAPIVLQLRKEIMQQGEKAVLRYVEEIHHHITKVLMDSSAGTGEEFDPATVVRWQRLFSKHFTGAPFTYGYAGGLDKDNTRQKIWALRTQLGNADFSVDIESKARRATGNAQVPDVLDTVPGGELEGYVEGSARGFARSM